MRLKPLDQCSGCFRLLLCLYLYGDSSGKEALRRDAQVSQDAMNHALGVLQGLDLVEEHPEEQFPFRKLIVLTDKGRRLVESPLAKWGQILY